jgi:hypothetical protein
MAADQQLSLSVIGMLACRVPDRRLCAWLPCVAVRVACAQIIPFGHEADDIVDGVGRVPCNTSAQQEVGDVLDAAMVRRRGSRALAGAICAGHELDRGGPRLGSHHGVDVSAAVAAVLGAVGGVDLVVEVVVGVG